MSDLSLPTPRWREPDATPFDVPVLDLSAITQGITSTTKDPAVAERAGSWRTSVGDELDGSALEPLEPVACELRYPVATIFPDGLIFTPSAMEDKWVIAHRNGALLAARSWTGNVDLVARTRREGDTLIAYELRCGEESVLASIGDVAEVFDWLVRSHALGQILPLPVDERGAEFLEQGPLAGFSAFGRKLLCAARSWHPGEPERPLRADGRMVQAARTGDEAELRRLVEAGESVQVPATFDGFTPLHIALIRGDTAMVRALLELGADPNALADRDAPPLIAGVVHEAPVEALELLIAKGANPRAVNADGFGALHAAGESGNSAIIPWLVEKGLDLEARTAPGHTALQIACALGEIGAARALLDAGADASADSPNGSALDIAREQGQAEAVELLEKR